MEPPKYRRIDSVIQLAEQCDRAGSIMCILEGGTKVRFTPRMAKYHGARVGRRVRAKRTMVLYNKRYGEHFLAAVDGWRVDNVFVPEPGVVYDWS